MGYLYCREMGGAFVNHLLHYGPISVRAAGNRYWKRHPRGYERDDEGHKMSALNALMFVACGLAEGGWITPTNRRKAIESCAGIIEFERVGDRYGEIDYSTIEQGIKDDIDYLCEEASLAFFNGYLIKCFAEDDSECRFEWFDPIVWKLTDQALTNPESIPVRSGVYL